MLCYVDKPWAYFTTQKLEDQWGDDWEDIPYQHNAEEPYGPCWHNAPEVRNDPNARRGYKQNVPNTKIPLGVGELCQCSLCKRDWNEDGTPRYQIIKVAFDGPFDTPAEGGIHSSYSVNQINAGDVPWLANDNAIPAPILIYAGTTLADFIEKIKAGGGNVFLAE